MSASARVRLAFSPDSDDIFMFWAALFGKIDTEGLEFQVERSDTESLNARAAAADLDVMALSVAAWPSVADRYLLLSSGMSVGRGYGPILAARRPVTLASLDSARIGVPGLRTTAYLVLRLLLPRFEAVIVPIVPFERVFDSVRSGDVDAALVIHEGRVTFEREGLASVCDLGEEWARLTGGLPLPLGANAVRRALGRETVERVSRVCRVSIEWALTHREDTMRALIEGEDRQGLRLTRTMLDRYLAMYANADTLEAPPDVRRAVDVLYERGHAAGLLEGPTRAEYAR
jgi:1,4-dihydroxy-6-naphthoate synthase